MQRLMQAPLSSQQRTRKPSNLHVSYHCINGTVRIRCLNGDFRVLVFKHTEYTPYCRKTDLHVIRCDIMGAVLAILSTLLTRSMNSCLRASRLLALLSLLVVLADTRYAWGDEDDAELVLTVDQAVQLALRNNRTLISARYRRELQRYALDVSEDRYRPRANVGALWRDTDLGASSADLSVGPALRVPTGGQFSLFWNQSLDGGNQSGGAGTLAFRQPLLRGFGMGVDTAPVRLARLDERKNLLFLRDTLADVIVAVVYAYRTLVRADQTLVIGRESLARAQRQVDVNRALIQAGRMAAQEIVQTEAEVANRELALAENENAMTRANASLLSVLDIDDRTVVRPVRTLPPIKQIEPGLDESIETALEHRNDYRRAELDEESAGITVRVAENDRLWDLTLNASVSRGIDGERDYGAGLGLDIPIGDRGPRLAALRARTNRQDARIRLAEMRQSIRIAVRQAIQDVDTDFRRVSLAQRARELAEQTVSVEQEKLSQGLSSTFRLTIAEDDLVTAKTRELDAIIAYLNAVTRLDWTLGTTLSTFGVDAGDYESVQH